MLGGEDYTGSATLTAMWEAGSAEGANRICFIANSPSGTVSGTMEDPTIVYMTSSTSAGTVDSTALSSSTTELTFYSPNWTLSGYGFRGWSTTPEGTAGTMYGPNQTITLTSDQQTQLGTYGLPIYAQWVASADDMDSWSGCSSLTQGSVTALTYGSDTYAVAKLADGKCWMIENMRTSTNAGTDKGTSWTTAVTDRQYNLANVTGSSPSATTSGSTAIQWKSYGGYYSWHSAINTTTVGSTQYYNWNTSSNSYTTTGTAQGICPSGWRLPRSYAGDSTTNNANSDFRNLNNILNSSWSSVSTAAASNNWRKYPNNFVFAGSWNGSSSNVRGTYGRYWSSTVNYSTLAYHLYFGSTSVNPASSNSKYYGYSVRCVASS
ncbi:hypothetical protein J6S39_00080 [Candidatus Saccharibacteria bacterium]|nr:hypothetical protein [Candidatus Saccharibacteria bacterium]